MPASLVPGWLACQLPLTVEAYVAACLYDATHGYYTRGLNFTSPEHPKGLDFTTAPLLTPLFGATLGNWVVRQWQQAGQPDVLRLIETGPGNGALMHSLLSHLHTAHPACYAVCQPWLVETSPTLTALQQQTLQPFPQCHWSTDIRTSNIEPSNIPTCVIANELLDAFPIRQFCGEEERGVLLREGRLAFSHPEDSVTAEDSPAQTAWLQGLRALPGLQAALLVDYGAAQAAGGSTLQAVHRHTQVSPLHLPGETDLTAHVNFDHVAAMLGTNHCSLTDLTPFLMQHGLLNLAEASITSAETQGSLHRLLHPNEMGSLFKVLEYLP
ncbi:MAG: SAM-dependent methyltransferase [Pseudomonadaceae bacterium]|nr:SAM-dependent methyltransferase [Pseudomonadaceae bacterium]